MIKILNLKHHLIGFSIMLIGGAISPSFSGERGEDAGEYSSIITTNSIRDVAAYIKTSETPNKMVLFDVDDVLIRQVEPLIRTDNHSKTNELLAFLRVSHAEYRTVWSTLMSQTPPVLVEEDIVPVLNELKAQKIQTLALTASGTGDYGMSKSLEDRRIAELRSLGIDFSASSLFQGTYPLMASLSLQSPPLYKEGIIFTCAQDKGIILRDFLWQSLEREEKVVLTEEIIFTDDSYSNLLSVQAMCQQLGIAFKGFHYTHASELYKTFEPLVPERAIERLQHILKVKSVLDARRSVAPLSCL